MYFSPCPGKGQTNRSLSNTNATVHRRRHGTYPDSLSKLTPHLLPTIPIDRFDGQPLKYRLTESGPILYSVGCDRTDDGGSPSQVDTFSHEVTRWHSVSQIKNARVGSSKSALLGDWILYPPRNTKTKKDREESASSTEER